MTFTGITCGTYLRCLTTLEEMLLSALSSISCSNSSANLISAEETSSCDMREILESSRSVAYIVGTHKDKVSEEYIASFASKYHSKHRFF